MTTPAMFSNMDIDFTKIEMDALPPELEGKSDQELADYALAHPALAPMLLPALPEGAKQEIGNQLAERGNDIRNSEDRLTKDELDEFGEVLDAYGADSVVSTSFLNTIEPEGLLDLSMKVALAHKDMSDFTNDDGFDPQFAESIQ